MLLALIAAASAVELERSGGLVGFDLARADLGGFVQPRYTWIPADPSASSPGDNGFTVRRARLGFEGTLAREGEGLEGLAITHEVSMELMPEARLVDAYVEVRLLEPLRVRAGQFKAPTNRSFLTSDRYTLFPDRGELVALVPQRELGVAVEGRLGENHLRYELGLFNGEGTNRLGNVNRSFLYAARAELSPLGAPTTRDELLAPSVDPVVTLGYAINFNVLGPEGLEEASIQHNGDVYVHWRWVTFQAELLYGITDWQDTAIEDFRELGAYAQAGVFLPKVPWARDHLALLARYERIDPFVAGEGSTTTLSGPTDPAQARQNLALGLGFYVGQPLFAAAQDLRFTATYEHRGELEGLTYDNDELMLGAHMSF